MKKKFCRGNLPPCFPIALLSSSAVKDAAKTFRSFNDALAPKSMLEILGKGSYLETSGDSGIKVPTNELAPYFS